MQSDLGLAAIAADPENRWLFFEPCYHLDILLLTPRNHPLARRRRVRATDLREFPLVNSPSSFANYGLNKALERLGLFKTQPRRVEAQSAAANRRYVAMGFGVGLITASPLHQPDPSIHERSMAGELGRLTVYAIRRKGALQPQASRDFVTIVKAVLERSPDRS
jgi:DNA-binding transcriptional LysR family regulator